MQDIYFYKKFSPFLRSQKILIKIVRNIKSKNNKLYKSQNFCTKKYKNIYIFIMNKNFLALIG